MSTEPLLAHAAKRWQRFAPYVIAFGFAVALLPTTVTVLVQDYQLAGGWAGRSPPRRPRRCCSP